MGRLPALASLLVLAACIPGSRVDAPADAAPVGSPTWRQTDAPRPGPLRRASTRPIATVTFPPFLAAAAAPPRRAVVAAALTSRAQVYTVAPGDTLRSIAAKTGAGSEAIARENRLEPPFVVRVRQRLRIPAGRWHLVQAGETGIAIARAYGVDWGEVTTINRLEEPFILRTGQRLRLPDAAQVANRSMEDRARAFQIDVDDLVTGAQPAIAEGRAPALPRATPARPLPSAVPVAEPRRFAGRFDWPAAGPLLARFGPVGRGRVNNGIEIASTRGAPIVASADGVVAYVGNEVAVLGGLVLIRHGGGWTTTYGHASEILVTRGQSVKRGQIIARAGDTGVASQPMLHFEIRRGRTPVDPLGELPGRS